MSFQIFDALRILSGRYNSVRKTKCTVKNVQKIAVPSNFDASVLLQTALSEKNTNNSNSDKLCFEVDWYEADIEYFCFDMLSNYQNPNFRVPYISADYKPMLCIGKVQFPVKAGTDLKKYDRLTLNGTLTLAKLDTAVLQMYRWYKKDDGTYQITTPLVTRPLPKEDSALLYILRNNNLSNGRLMQKVYSDRNIGISGVAESQNATRFDFGSIDCRTLEIAKKAIMSDLNVSEVKTKSSNFGVMLDYVNNMNGRVGTVAVEQRSVLWEQKQAALLKSVETVYSWVSHYKLNLESFADIEAVYKEQKAYSEASGINLCNALFNTVLMLKECPYRLAYVQNITLAELDKLFDMYMPGGLTDITDVHLAMRREAVIHISLNMKAKTLEELNKERYSVMHLNDSTFANQYASLRQDSLRTLAADIKSYAFEVKTLDGVLHYVDGFGLYLLKELFAVLRTPRVSLADFAECCSEVCDSFSESFYVDRDITPIRKMTMGFKDFPVYLQTKNEDHLLVEQFLKHMKSCLSDYADIYLIDMQLIDGQGINGLKAMMQKLSPVVSGMFNERTAVIFYGQPRDKMLVKLLKQSMNTIDFSNDVNRTDFENRLLVFAKNRESRFDDLPVLKVAGCENISKAFIREKNRVLAEYSDDVEWVSHNLPLTHLETLQKLIQFELYHESGVFVKFQERSHIFYEKERVRLLRDLSPVLKKGYYVYLDEIGFETAGKVRFVVRGESGDRITFKCGLNKAGECTVKNLFGYGYIRDYSEDVKLGLLSFYKKHIALISSKKSVSEYISLICSGRSVRLYGDLFDYQKHSNLVNQQFGNPLEYLF